MFNASHPLIFISMFLSVTNVYANLDNSLDIEAGIAFTGYNDIAVPASQANQFSLKDDLTSDPVGAVRIRYGRQFDKHWLGLLVAPLTVKSSGQFDKDITFKGDVFRAGEQIDAVYRFDSYRLLYRYLFIQRPRHQFSFGGALKVRDAEIRLKNTSNNTPRKNLGFVPLLSFNYTHKTTDKLNLIIDGEALVAPQGRAEDVFFGATYAVNPHMSLKAGYRILEGGADNEKLYTFSLFNYITAGVILSF